MACRITYDQREWASGVPGQLMLQPDLELDAQTLPRGDYLVGDVVIERKSRSDLVASIRDRRLFEQVADLAAAEGLHAILLVERGDRGRWSPGEEGALAWVMRAGVSVMPVADADEVASWIARMARHIDARPDGPRVYATRSSRDPDEQARAVLAHAPGIGARGADALLRHFGSLRAVVLASEQELLAAPGIGRTRASALHALFDRAYPLDPFAADR